MEAPTLGSDLPKKRNKKSRGRPRGSTKKGKTSDTNAGRVDGGGGRKSTSKVAAPATKTANPTHHAEVAFAATSANPNQGMAMPTTTTAIATAVEDPSASSGAAVPAINTRPMNGVEDGYGTYLFQTGVVYTGYFKNNLFHGEGVLEFPDGMRAFTTWENDQATSMDYDVSSVPQAVPDVADEIMGGGGGTKSEEFSDQQHFSWNTLVESSAVTAEAVAAAGTVDRSGMCLS